MASASNVETCWVKYTSSVSALKTCTTLDMACNGLSMHRQSLIAAKEIYATHAFLAATLHLRDMAALIPLSVMKRFSSAACQSVTASKMTRRFFFPQAVNPTL